MLIWGVGRIYDRVGEHAAAAWKSVNLIPLEASQSMFGVLVSPPKQPHSENPRLSATIMRSCGCHYCQDMKWDILNARRDDKYNFTKTFESRKPFSIVFVERAFDG